jgi:hypothetical protein
MFTAHDSAGAGVGLDGRRTFSFLPGCFSALRLHVHVSHFESPYADVWCRLHVPVVYMYS